MKTKRKEIPDCRGLVPRTPPEGLAAWAYVHCQGLKRSGMLYEVEWVSEMGLAECLSPDPKPKRIKMVRVTCSACGQGTLMEWNEDPNAGYGFRGDYECAEGGLVFADGDEKSCPHCGERCLVRKRSSLGRFGYFVSGEVSVMSASLAGEENMLALTVWTAQNRVYKSGQESLVLIPAEAYVFSRDGCVQLMGWRNSYSGSAGYFISYSLEWRQPKKWTHHRLECRAIFGLTEALLAQSSLPHCKLDVYMDQFQSLCKKYPVSYLLLYQEHSNVEALLLHGLPLVLHELIEKEFFSEIHWEETRPAAMLGLTRDELRLGRKQGWGAFLWRLFTRAKAVGEQLTADDIYSAFELADENVLDLVGRGPVGKSIRYLRRQMEMCVPEAEGQDPQPYDIVDAAYLLDYWRMAEIAGRNLNDTQVRFPDDLVLAHDTMIPLAKACECKQLDVNFRVRRKQLRKYSFQADGLLIRPARSRKELADEGNVLHHCVGTYAKDYAEGRTAIFFIRRVSAPKESYFTLELNERSLEVRQNRGLKNCARTDEVWEFEHKWLAWIRTGCRQDEKGRHPAA